MGYSGLGLLFYFDLDDCLALAGTWMYLGMAFFDFVVYFRLVSVCLFGGFLFILLYLLSSLILSFPQLDTTFILPAELVSHR